jgi:hypothetical protein
VVELSNTGRLYLNEFYILNEARKDLEFFLDALTDSVFQQLMMRKVDFSSNHFSWDVWRNKSTYGRIDVEFKVKEKVPLFRDGKADIYIIYEDIRHTVDLKNHSTIKISVWSPSAAKGVEQTIKQEGLKNFQTNIYEVYFVEINVEDSSETAKKIVEHITEKSKLIFMIIERILASQISSK